MKKAKKYYYDIYDRKLKLLLAMGSYYCHLDADDCTALELLIEETMSRDVSEKIALIWVLYIYERDLNYIMKNELADIISDVPSLDRKGKSLFKIYSENVFVIIRDTLRAYNKKYR